MEALPGGGTDGGPAWWRNQWRPCLVEDFCRWVDGARLSSDHHTQCHLPLNTATTNYQPLLIYQSTTSVLPHIKARLPLFVPDYESV